MSTVIEQRIDERKSRWGYHPCDYKTYLKLKEAHGLLLRAYRDVKRFIRWDNKLPHNRNGERPRCPEHLIEVGMHHLDKRWFYGRGFARHKDLAGVAQNLYLHVLRQYQLARRPKPTPEEVESLDIPKNLDKIVADLREYYNE